MNAEDIKPQISQAFGLSNSEGIIKTKRGYMIHKEQILKFNIEKLQDICITFDTCTFDCDVVLNIGSNIDCEFVSCNFNQVISSDFRYQMIKNYYSFKNCIFYNRINLAFLKITKQMSFSDSLFYGDINCHQSEFEDLAFVNLLIHGRVDLRECSFKNATFKENLFADRVLFDRARFNLKEKVLFDRIRFEGGAYFEGTSFCNGAEFHSNLFQKNFIFSPEENKGISFNSCFFEANLISDFNFIDHASSPKLQRKMFSSIKASLLKSLNNFDASNYHRMELYCKEEELKFNKPKIFSKDWIDKWQLSFYRHTSDHHTDIFKSFNSLIALIGIFGLLCGAVVWGLDYFVFDHKEGVNILKLKEIYSSHIEASIKEHILSYVIGNIVLFFVFLGLFLGVVWECLRNLFVPLGYIAVLGFFAISPKYLVPAMSFFDSKKALLDPICTLGGLYTLLFGFLAYSFIKTTRKNSIIPS